MEWSCISLTDSSKILMLMVRLTATLVVVMPNLSERLKHRRRARLHPDLCGTPCRSTF